MNGITDQSDSRKYYKALAALMWAALPVNGLLYAFWWSRLPARLATHFNFNNQPNGWMTREESLIFSLVIALVMVITASLVLSKVQKPDPAAWALLALFYVILGTLLSAEQSLIGYNVSGTPVNVAPILITGISAALLVTAVALATRRGTQLETSNVVAEEKHGSAVFGFVLFAPAIAFLMIAYSVAITGVRIAIGLGALLMLAGAAAAWDGFHYLFSAAGIEIRTLGFRLRSIPVAEIQSYAVDTWSAIRGYGIRGVGNKRAYVWGNGGVRIKLSDGEVFLGHSEAGRVIHDLDLITRGHKNIS